MKRRVSKIKHWANNRINSFTNSEKFKTFCCEAFNEVDLDGNGTVNVDEIYLMVLKLYLKLAAFTSIASGTVPTKEQVQKLFEECDQDKNGKLDRTEFLAIAVVLCEGMALRISVQIIVKNLLCPLLAISLVRNLRTIKPTWMTGIIDDYIEDIMKILISAALMNSLFNIMIYGVDTVLRKGSAWHVGGISNKISWDDLDFDGSEGITDSHSSSQTDNKGKDKDQ